MKRNCPSKFIGILDNWFSETYTLLKWENITTQPVKLVSGVRHGSILSPVLFAVYVDDMITKLENSHHGCHIKSVAFNVMMYADDLLLLSLSIVDLQCFVDICTRELNDLDMKINSTKSCCLRIGPRTSIPAVNILVNDNNVSWSSLVVNLNVIFI